MERNEDLYAEAKALGLAGKLADRYVKIQLGQADKIDPAARTTRKLTEEERAIRNERRRNRS